MAKKKGSNKEESNDKKISFPMETIESAVEFITSIVNENGFTKPMKNQDLAIVKGKHASQLIYICSACIQYGLLSIEYGVGYIPTKRFHDIINPVFEGDKMVAYYEAMKSPNSYRILIERFNGRMLPEISGFINLLKGEFKLKPNPAGGAVSTFMENANFLKLIGDNRKLKFIMPERDGAAHEEYSDEVRVEAKTLFTPPTPITPVADASKNQFQFIPNGNGNLYSQPVPLGKDRIAVIQYPKGSLQKHELQAIKMMLDLIEMSEGLKEIKPSEVDGS